MTAPTLVEGAIVEHDGRLWRVGLVNQSRARLDPLAGEAVLLATGRSFTSYGGSINVGPTSTLKTVGLDDPAVSAEVKRRIRVLTQGARANSNTEAEANGNSADEIGEEGDMSATMVETNVSGAPVPSKKAVKLTQTKTAKGAAAGAPVPRKLSGAAAKAAAAPKKEKAPKVMKACTCGCGGQTASYFIPGHDARFKGWLLKIEKGEASPEDLIPKKVRERFQWKKKGAGQIPTLNYKGLPHKGYLG